MKKECEAGKDMQAMWDEYEEKHNCRKPEPKPKSLRWMKKYTKKGI